MKIIINWQALRHTTLEHFLESGYEQWKDPNFDNWAPYPTSMIQTVGDHHDPGRVHPSVTHARAVQETVNRELEKEGSTFRIKAQAINVGSKKNPTYDVGYKPDHSQYTGEDSDLLDI